MHTFLFKHWKPLGIMIIFGERIQIINVPWHLAACRPKCIVSTHTPHLVALVLRPMTNRCGMLCFMRSLGRLASFPLWAVLRLELALALGMGVKRLGLGWLVGDKAMADRRRGLAGLEEGLGVLKSDRGFVFTVISSIIRYWLLKAVDTIGKYSK